MACQHHNAEATRKSLKAKGTTMKKPDTPFPRHWLYYITTKFVVIAAAMLLALYVFYRVM